MTTTTTTTHTTSTGPVDDVVATIERSLCGPRRARKDAVREVRDGLEDAVEGYRDAGWEDTEAQRRAVADFGDPHEVAAELSDELVGAYGRRVATRMGVAFVSLVLLWDSLWVTGAARPEPMPEAATVFGRLVDGLSVLAAAGCVVAVLLSVWRARRGLGAARVTRAVGMLGLGALAGIGACTVLMNVLKASQGPGVYAYPATYAVMAVTVGVVLWVLVCGRRCLRLDPW